MEIIMETITNKIEKLILLNNGTKIIEKFNTNNICILLCEYIKRIKKYMKLNDDDFIYIYIYLERLNTLEYKITMLNIQNIIGILCVLYVKMYYDIHYSNQYYCYVVNLPLEILNELEIECLIMLNYNLIITN